MPDKRTEQQDHHCVRCWRNRLKHGNKMAKRYLKTHRHQDFTVSYPENIISIPEKTLEMEYNGLPVKNW